VAANTSAPGALLRQQSLGLLALQQLIRQTKAEGLGLRITPHLPGAK
jgi:hypothetical protein